MSKVGFLWTCICLLAGLMSGVTVAKLDRPQTQAEVEGIERKLNICLTNNDALLGMVDTTTAELQNSTDTLNRTTATLEEGTASLLTCVDALDECTAARWQLATQFGCNTD